MTSVLVLFVDKGLSSIHSLNFIVYYQKGMNKDKSVYSAWVTFFPYVNKLFKECRGCMGKKEVHLGMNVLRLTADSSNTLYVSIQSSMESKQYTRIRTLIVATIYLQLIQNRYMLRSFTVLQCSHQHCVQPVASDVEVVGYL